VAIARFRAEKSCVQIEVTAAVAPSFRLRCPVLETDHLIRKLSAESAARIKGIGQTSDCRHAAGRRA